ncbi:hypothetical protein B0H11DRAFT_2123567 [Mycena galericulata]|nr:hypothetical protein B0H11DRAFT_2123567 [Mycena galericulata]
MPNLSGEHISISDGLNGQDDHIETLLSLWEQLQLCSLEVAAQPECDLFSFAQFAFFLGVITVENSSTKLTPTHVEVPPIDAPPTVTPFPRRDSEDVARRLSSAEEQLDGIMGQNRITSPSVLPGPYISSGTPIKVEKSDDTLQSPNAFKSKNGPEEQDNSEWPASWAGDESETSKRTAPSLTGAGGSTSRYTSSPLSDGSNRNAAALTSTVPFSFASSSLRDTQQKLSSSIHTRRAHLGHSPAITSYLSPRNPPRPKLPKLPSSFWDPKPARHEDLFKAVQIGASRKAIGVIYLAASPLAHVPPNQVGELSLGILLDPAHRGKGYAREAIQLVVKHAFEVKHCHRIQASLLNLHWSSKDRMVSLLTQLRFGHEGTKRRAFFNPLIAEWQDVTTLAILDTDWAMRSFFKPAPKSLWDELFLRHERERDELLRWEADQNMETLRAVNASADTDANDSDAPSAASSSKSSKSKSKVEIGDSDFSAVRVVRRHVDHSDSELSRMSSPTPSDASVESVPRSETTAGSGDWDMLESSSSGSSSFWDDNE